MNHKILQVLKEKDVADVGIGAMIVFIAMVLVAGVAASVLIQTAGKLETQAMSSGQQTIAEVSSGIAVIDVVGKTGTSDLKYLAITVRARAGAPDIDINQTRIVISDGTKKTVLLYDGWIDPQHYNATVNSSNAQLFDTGNWDSLTFEKFGIIVLQDQDGSCQRATPVINKGDKVVLTLLCSASGCFGREIPTRTQVYGRVIPEIGSPGVIAFTTPAAYNDVVYDLQ
ncbi:MAG: flagellin [Candidatus Thermoplasmatota archaeon]